MKQREIVLQREAIFIAKLATSLKEFSMLYLFKKEKIHVYCMNVLTFTEINYTFILSIKNDNILIIFD